ncbi:hypothetical protein KQX54_002202 [Cotesia glomerata]|uniref:Uncharacterized protein n=1 Tax=Cotesia glomerata TaxID=32391 RepID=A0AAV7IIX3_COTGL|nr:hypothetical protein KQX54_002202 [Cotesia glomerata]
MSRKMEERNQAFKIVSKGGSLMGLAEDFEPEGGCIKTFRHSHFLIKPSRFRGRKNGGLKKIHLPRKFRRTTINYHKVKSSIHQDERRDTRMRGRQDYELQVGASERDYEVKRMRLVEHPYIESSCPSRDNRGVGLEIHTNLSNLHAAALDTQILFASKKPSFKVTRNKLLQACEFVKFGIFYASSIVPLPTYSVHTVLAS